MKIKTILTLAIATVVLAGCGPKPMATETSSNGAEAQLIAVVEGCNVYRLYDGRYFHVTICKDATRSEVSETHKSSDGKRTYETTNTTIYKN